MTTVRRYDEPFAFQQHVSPFLLTNEAYHHLILGLCATLVSEPGRYPNAKYQAVAEAEGNLVGVAICTPPHNVVLSVMTDPSTVSALAVDVHDWRPTIPGVLGPTDATRAFAEQWLAVASEALQPSTAMRIFELERVNPVSGVPGAMRPATTDDRPLLVEWWTDFIVEAFGGHEPEEAEQTVDARLASPFGGYVVWWDQEIVSLAGYGSPTPSGIRIGPVYTPPARRGRGYASALVAALSQSLLDHGRRRCYLVTDLANPTSNHIYQAIGYLPVGDMDIYHRAER